MTIHRLQIAFMTGRSNPKCWHLSVTQRMFLERMAAPQRHLVLMNFPYRTNSGPVKNNPLWLASLQNAKEYLAARHASFVINYKHSVTALLEQSAHTVLLAGSCGLELFNCLQLEQHWLERTSVFAYGPVARRLPCCQTLLIQGRRDLISRLWVRQADLNISTGHLGYLQNHEMVTHCQAFIEAVEQERFIAS